MESMRLSDAMFRWNRAISGSRHATRMTPLAAVLCVKLERVPLRPSVIYLTEAGLAPIAHCMAQGLKVLLAPMR